MHNLEPSKFWTLLHIRCSQVAIQTLYIHALMICMYVFDLPKWAFYHEKIISTKPWMCQTHFFKCFSTQTQPYNRLFSFAKNRVQNACQITKLRQLKLCSENANLQASVHYTHAINKLCKDDLQIFPPKCLIGQLPVNEKSHDLDFMNEVPLKYHWGWIQVEVTIMTWLALEMYNLFWTFYV